MILTPMFRRNTENKPGVDPENQFPQTMKMDYKQS